MDLTIANCAPGFLVSVAKLSNLCRIPYPYVQVQDLLFENDDHGKFNLAKATKKRLKHDFDANTTFQLQPRA